MNVVLEIIQAYTNFLEAYVRVLFSPAENLTIVGLTIVISVGAGIVPIVKYLLDTKHASPETQEGKAAVRCWDLRWLLKAVAILGGGATFDFGTAYFFVSTLVPDPVKQVFVGLAISNFFWSSLFTVQMVFVVVKNRKQIRNEKGFVFWILAHLLGCGWVTASGIVFPLFWLQEWAKRSNHATTEMVIMRVRDLETFVRLAFSTPFILVMNIVVIPAVRKFALPGIDLKKEGD